MNGQKKSFSKFKNMVNLKKSVLFGSVVSLGVVPCSIVSATNLTKDSNYENWKNSNKNVIKSVDVEGYNSTWSMTYVDAKTNKSVTKTFNSPQEMSAYANQYITSERYATSVDLESYKNNSTKALENIDWNKVNKLNDSESGESLSKTIYQGLNNKTYESIDAAIDSYYEVESGYYFNDIYFANQVDLKNYLKSNFFANGNNVNYKTIVLNGPNGVSTPISLSDPNQALANIKNFVDSNASVALQYDNGKTKLNITESNLNSVMESVDENDLSYVNVKSNEGESRYVLDNYDDANLIGPYLYNGVLDVGAFTNKNMWQKVNGVSKQVYTASKINNMIGSFFSTVIVDDKALNLSEYNDGKTDIPLFRTTMIASDGVSSYFVDENGKEIREEITLDEWFLKQLELISPELKKDVVEANIQLMRGKKYNTFYKIPVLYTYLLQRIMALKLEQNAIDLVVYYFSQVCNYIQDTIEIILMDDKLLYNDEGVKFDLKTLFQIGNKNYDLNTNVDTFFNDIKKWSKLIMAMDVYMGAYINLFMTAGLIPFYAYDQSYLIESGIMTWYEYETIKESLANIYLTFSQSDYGNTLSIFVSKSTDPRIVELSKKDTSTWDKALDEMPAKYSATSVGNILKNAVESNNQHQTLAKVVLNNEIKIYLTTGSILTEGYLSLLYSKKANYNRVDAFVNFVRDNADLDVYKVYMAFLLDIRMNHNILTGSALASKDAFAVALSRVIYLTLGTAAMVGSSISNLYTQNWSDTASNATITPSLVDRLERLRSVPSPENSQLWDVVSNGSIKSNAATTAGSILENIVDDTVSDVIYLNPADFNFSNIKNPSTPTTPTSLGFLDNFAGVDWDKVDIEADVNNIYKFGNKVEYAQIGSINDVVDGFKKSKVPSLKTSLGNIALDVNDWSDYIKKDKWYKKFKLTSPKVEISLFNSISYPRNKTNVKISSIIADLPDYTNKKFTFKGVSDSVDGLTRTTTFSSSFKKKMSMQSLYKAGNKAWDTAQKIGSALKSIFMPLLSVAIAGLETFFFINDLISEKTTQDFYVYTTSDGTQFIWDGGMTVSKYMGLSVNQTVGIDSMKLAKPIQVTLPQVEEYLYYNGVKYYDFKDLKRSQLLYMIRNRYVNNYNKYDPNAKSRFSLVYTFSKDINSVGNVTASTIDGLVEYILDDIGATKNSDGTYDFSNIKKESQFIASGAYEVDGINNNLSGKLDDIEKMAQKVVDSIRKTNIVLLPEVDVYGKTTGTKKEFKYPGKSWNSTTGQVVTNSDTSMKYIVDNSANMKNSTGFANSNEATAIAASQSALKQKFIQEMTTKVSTKNVLAADYLAGNQDYTSLNGNWTIANLYRVALPNSKIVYFASSEEAQTYVAKALNFTKNKQVVGQNYIFNGVVYSESQLKSLYKSLSA